MENNNENYSPRGGGVVEVKSPSKKANIVSKAASLVLAAGTLAGAAQVINSNVHAQGSDDRAIVTVLDKDPSAQGNSQRGQKDNAGEQHSASGETQELQASSQLFDTVFHNLDSAQVAQARQKVDEYKSEFLSEDDFEAAKQKINLEYGEIIKETAKVYGISEDSLAGIVFVESRGDANAYNENSEALGVVQFLAVTANQYGLISNPTTEQRRDPQLSIPAAGRYLKENKALLGGDEGMSVESYHAGIGNMYRALREYFLDVNKEDIGDFAGSLSQEDVVKKAQKLIEQDDLDVSELLSNLQVKTQVTDALKDESDQYILKVVAASELLKAAPEQALQGGGLEGRTADLGGGLKIEVASTPGAPIR